MTIKSLTIQAIHQAIDEVCGAVTENQNLLSFRRTHESEFTFHSSARALKEEDTPPNNVDTSLLFGFITSLKNSKPDTSTFLTTFYLAYSTWDGRVLYLDHRGVSERHDNNSRNTLAQLIRLVLCKIAIQLDCCRFTWQHYDKVENYGMTIQPETLYEVLTLHWDAESMKTFAGENSKSVEPLSIQQATEQSLALQNHESFQLRLASVNDLETIGRMVQGLADHVKEPDAVNLTKDQYQIDGFENHPLFYCVLMDYISDNCPCGMAFCVLGYKLGQGRFLYLEDLFIEESYRGKGGGTFVMRALASAAYSLGCERLVWQALGWNEKGLAFYQRIGAKVLDSPRLQTSRFAGEALKQYADLSETELVQRV